MINLNGFVSHCWDVRFLFYIPVISAIMFSLRNKNLEYMQGIYNQILVAYAFIDVNFE